MFTWKTSTGIKIKLLKIGITNCYLVEDNRLNILVDTGSKRFSEKIISLLRNNLNGKLDYIMLTHTHYDHSQNTKKISDLFNAKLIVHQMESECMAKGYTPIPKGTMLLTKLISYLGKKFTPQMAAYEAITPDIKIKSDYLIDNNPALKIIETPGHTAGSISLIIDNEIAIVGDTMFGHMKRSILTPFGNDIPMMIQSWKKLYELKCSLYLPAHGKAIKPEKLESQISAHF